jgi:hypothetical protein
MFMTVRHVVSVPAVCAAVIVFLPLFVSAQTRMLELRDSGFEEGSGVGMPAGWSIVRPAPAPSGTARIDASVCHSGNRSLHLAAREPGSITVESSPVTLTIGQLYRLSAWVRTAKAFSDPTSRYPTAVAATVTMASFPFTNHAPVVGGTQGWTRIEVLFFATQTEDRARLHLGLNGSATGEAWFDDLQVEQVDNIAEYIPLETVRWYGPAFRYTDKGWTFVHIEGEPYTRGYQYGFLLSKEIVAYMDKLAIRQNGDNAKAGWNDLRTLADALMLRKYDPEYLEEMKGIADGAAKAGGTSAGRAVDFLDIVTVNSAVDIGQLGGALNETPHALSGRSFKKEEEEINAAERLHKCSSFLANGPATRDSKIVFGQLFMWNGYTGVHWDIICDVVPAKGHRLVYETFPGGIHSGADFYINEAGIMMGETTVMQTPFNIDGEPQSSRIRKAAQYASSIDDAVRILTTKNNGLYTNDWLIGDAKTNEIAILLLGTKQHKLWRSSSGEFPGNTKGFYWSVNNAKDPEVRKEYVPDPTNAPYDLIYGNVNRDLSFYQYYQREQGKIDALSAVNVMATSPINRPHACDGKVTDGDMASHMMFLAHYGKVTLREKVPEKGSRLMSDLPGAQPHLTLGYSVINPVFVAEKLKGLRANPPAEPRKEQIVDEVKELYCFEKKFLWMNTVYPASEGDNWFVSGTAAYWNMLNGLPADPGTAMPVLRDQLTDMNCRLLYTVAREGAVAPAKAQRVYDRYSNYVIPRIRGTFALHQLRLALGNTVFAEVMNAVHSRFREKPLTTEQFLKVAEEKGGRSVRNLLVPWLEREDLPALEIRGASAAAGDGWQVTLDVQQAGFVYPFSTTIAIETGKEVQWRKVTVNKANESFAFDVKEKPRRIVFNAGNDIPVSRPAYYTFSNFFDDFTSAQVVYGTGRQIEAGHSAALKFQTVLADQFVEYLLPVRQDAEMSDADLAAQDLIVLGGAADNSVMRRLAERLGLTMGKNMFRWNDRIYADPDDGLFVAFPNPFNPARVVYLFAGNSALQMYHMTKRFTPLWSWGIFKGENVVERGYHPVRGLEIDVPPK